MSLNREREIQSGVRARPGSLAPSAFTDISLSRKPDPVYVFRCTHAQKAINMVTSTTMTIRLNPQLKEKLGRLADGTRRSRSFLAAEAVEAYVDRELAIIEGIERGLADANAGQTVSHEDAMATVRRAIEVAAGGTG
jgi:predicted transcriptional regulator